MVYRPKITSKLQATKKYSTTTNIFAGYSIYMLYFIGGAQRPFFNNLATQYGDVLLSKKLWGKIPIYLKN